MASCSNGGYCSWGCNEDYSAELAELEEEALISDFVLALLVTLGLAEAPAAPAPIEVDEDIPF